MTNEWLKTIFVKDEGLTLVKNYWRAKNKCWEKMIE